MKRGAPPLLGLPAYLVGFSVYLGFSEKPPFGLGDARLSALSTPSILSAAGGCGCEASTAMASSASKAMRESTISSSCWCWWYQWSRNQAVDLTRSHHCGEKSSTCCNAAGMKSGASGLSDDATMALMVSLLLLVCSWSDQNQNHAETSDRIQS